jgi:hypothetical protein
VAEHPRPRQAQAGGGRGDSGGRSETGRRLKRFRAGWPTTEGERRRAGDIQPRRARPGPAAAGHPERAHGSRRAAHRGAADRRLGAPRFGAAGDPPGAGVRRRLHRGRRSPKRRRAMCRFRPRSPEHRAGPAVWVSSRIAQGRRPPGRRLKDTTTPAYGGKQCRGRRAGG